MALLLGWVIAYMLAVSGVMVSLGIYIYIHHNKTCLLYFQILTSGNYGKSNKSTYLHLKLSVTKYNNLAMV